jgi:hypothetical protein
VKIKRLEIEEIVSKYVVCGQCRRKMKYFMSKVGGYDRLKYRVRELE